MLVSPGVPLLSRRVFRSGNIVPSFRTQITASGFPIGELGNVCLPTRDAASQQSRVYRLGAEHEPVERRVRVDEVANLATRALCTCSAKASEATRPHDGRTFSKRSSKVSSCSKIVICSSTGSDSSEGAGMMMDGAADDKQGEQTDA